jgi:hypothetical protein
VRAPALRATIERRILVNYRVEPRVLEAVVPHPFRPALTEGFGIAGVCLIRLGDIRLAGVPRALGLTAENAAHRVAVQWDTPDGVASGVYIPRRDTSSRLVALVGGRLFPGWQHLADFDVHERDGRYRVGVKSHDGAVSIVVSARLADGTLTGSVFGSVDEASAFFRCAPLGYAATARAGVFDGVELGTCGWGIQPLEVEEASTSFFADPIRFPPGSAALDSAFLMERLDTTWTPQPRLVARSAR